MNSMPYQAVKETQAAASTGCQRVLVNGVFVCDAASLT